MRMERTKLHRFLETVGINNTELARESGVSLRHVDYVKRGEREPTRPVMAAILSACRRLAKRRDLAITDLFDFVEKKEVA